VQVQQVVQVAQQVAMTGLKEGDFHNKMAIDASKYATKGSTIEAQINNANRMADDAIKAGVNPDKLNQYLSQIEGSLQAKNLNGFKSNLSTFNDSIRSEMSQKQTADKVVALEQRFAGMNKQAQALGVPIDPAQVELASNLLNSGQVDQASTVLTEMAKPIESAAALMQKNQIELQATAGKGVRELNPNQLQEYSNIAAMKLGSKEYDADGLVQPQNVIAMTEAAKNRDQAKLQAREVFGRLKTVHELMASGEYMNEFGDTPATDFFQSMFATSDNAAVMAKLRKLKGGDLAQGMKDIKEQTGTAAGMAVEETKALQASINDLSSDLSPKEAEIALRKIVDNAKFTLERLGVDPELTSVDGTARVLANKEKYIFADERAYIKKKAEENPLDSGSTLAPDTKNQDQKARAAADAFKNSFRKRQ
jgi:hypothetical protein